MLTVLLAAYNGERYISDQIYSILQADNDEDTKIVISLDKSTDRTSEIVSLIAEKSGNIELVKHAERIGSAKGNFSWMISKYSGQSDYYMLSDQDDVWLNDKIVGSKNEIKEMERIYGADTPCLVFTDSVVVDESLEKIYDSFIISSQFDAGKRNTFKKLIVQNIAQGCTFMYNDALAKYLRLIPNDIIMHDWWLILVASYFGQVSFLDKKTMLYRQHTSNEVGAVKFSVFSSILKLIKGSSSFKKSIEMTRMQANTFLTVYEKNIDNETKKFLMEFSNSSGLSFIKRKKFLYKNKVTKAGILRTVGLYAFF